MKTYLSLPFLIKLVPQALPLFKTRFATFQAKCLCSIACTIFSFSLVAQVSVTATMGVSGPTTYGSVKLAFDAINNGTHQGVISIGLTGSTTETATAVLNGSGAGVANYSAVNIYPEGGSRSISGALDAALVDLNGADNVTIDGLNTGGNALTISNSSNTAAASTIRYILDANNNVIQNCSITGSGTSSGFGTIFFSTGSTTGNSNNIISGNSISCAGSNLPANAIYSSGTAAYPNTGITISNNNIYNYLTKGIEVGATGSSGWTIQDNSFFKEAGIFNTYNSLPPVYGIRILGGAGYTISNNFIGGEGSHLSGGNATYDATGSFSYIGIMLTTGAATPASNIKGNIIAKITISNVASSSPFSFLFYGIETGGSGINIGGALAGEGNSIGSASANGSISLSTSTVSGNGSTIYGVYCHSSGGVINGNQVAGIDINNTGSNPGSSDFRGIYVSIGKPPLQVNNNTIGSTTTANSIRVMATSTAPSTNLTGFYLGSTISSALPQVDGNTVKNISHLSAVSSGSFTGINAQNGYVQSYQNNTISDIYAAPNSSASSLGYTGILSSTSLSPSTIIANNIINNIDYRSSGTAAKIRGMEISGSSPKVSTVNSNTFSNFRSLSQKTALAETDDPSVFTIVGLLFSTGGTTSEISNNNFYNFSSETTAGLNTVVAGLAVISGGGGNIYGNRFSGFTNSATGVTSLPGIIGIKAFKGTFSVYNNAIKISNAAFTNGVNMYGIVQNTTGTTWNYFHNSVFITGTASGTAARSAAFLRITEGGVLVKDNLFINTRTGAGNHYAISNSVAAPATSWLSSSSNYNDIYSSNTDATAEWGTGTSNTFTQFQANSGGDANSINKIVSFVTSDFDLQPVPTLNCNSNNAGVPITTPVVITNDLTGATRSATNPDLGAYEYTYIPPAHSATNDGAKCVGQNISMNVANGAGDAPFVYSWTGPNSFVAGSQNPVLNNVTQSMAGIYTVLVTDANGCTGTANTTAAINDLPSGTLQSDVGSTTSMGSTVVFTAAGGTSYNFKLNGNSIQNSASSTYTTSSLTSGSVITVTVTNSNSCIATYPSITMTVASIMVNGKTYLKWNGKQIKKWNGISKN